MGSTRRIELSPKERQLLALLPADGQRVDTHALVEAFYHDQEVPFNARTIISGRMRSIMAKLERNGATDMQVFKSGRRGPHPVEYWRSGG